MEFLLPLTPLVCVPHRCLHQAQERWYDAKKVKGKTGSTSSHLEMSRVQLLLS